MGIAEIPSVCTFSSDLQIKHHLIFFTLKRVFLLKMKGANSFASIPYPEVCKYIILFYFSSYCFQITVKKWGLLKKKKKKLLTLYKNPFRVSWHLTKHLKVMIFVLKFEPALFHMSHEAICCSNRSQRFVVSCVSASKRGSSFCSLTQLNL